MSSRARINQVRLDLFDWEADGRDYRVELIITDDERLSSTLRRAIDKATDQTPGETQLANGAIRIRARRLKPDDSGADP